MAGENLSYITAFVAGSLTFLSPCILPIIPSFLAYISGVSFADLKDADNRSGVRSKVIIHTLLFILGFSVVFIVLGLTATAIGKLLFRYQKAINVIGGILIAFFGIYLTGVLNIGFLAKERRFKFPVQGASYIGSFLVGVTFAAAWTPCAGPILGSILVMAGTKADLARGAQLLVAYSLGIAVPFLLTALAMNSFLALFNRFKKALNIITVTGGIFLVIVGVLVATGYFSVVSERVMSSFAR